MRSGKVLSNKRVTQKNFTISSSMLRNSRQNWPEIFEKFDDVEPHNDRVSGSASHGYQLKIRSITGYQSLGVPNAYSLTYQIRVSFYDTVYGQFFGETWKSLPISSNNDSQQMSELSCNKVLYFHTPIADSNVVLVVEIVVYQEPKNPLPGEEITVTTKTFGWGVIRPFKPEFPLKDVSNEDAPTVRKMDVYQGTPRALLFMKDQIETNDLIQLVGGCQLSYTMRKHASMEPVLHLMPENVIFSSSQCLPGMMEVTAKSGLVDNFLSPKAIPPQTCYLDSVALEFGSMTVEKFENQLCDRINKDRLLKDRTQDDGKTVSITERRLMVGVHNGYCYIQKPQFAQLELEAVMGSRFGSFGRGKRKDASLVTKQSSSCLVLRSRLRLDEMVNDPGLAIVMQVEYLLALPYTNQANVTGSAGSIRSQPLSISVRWTAWTPFTQNIANEFVTLNLQGGMMKNPDNVLFYTRDISADQSNEEVGKLRFRFLTSDSVIPSESSVYASESDFQRSNSLSTKPPLPSQSPVILRQAAPKSSFHNQSNISHVAQAENMYQVGIAHLEMAGDTPPVHAPPILPVGQRTPSMSRAAYARLYSAGFPQIVDRHNNPPEVIDPTETIDCINMQEALADSLQTNEIIIQFLAYSKPQPGPGEAAPPDLNNIFCSFQFYRFQSVTTNRMNLSKQNDAIDDKGIRRFSSNQAFILRKVEAGETLDKGRPGLEIKYFVDPANMNVGENEAFISYLHSHILHIDVWDGDSLMLVGTVGIPLMHLLRQGKPAVIVDHELDVVFTEHTDTIPTVTGDVTGAGKLRPMGLIKTHRGKLHMRFGNVGYVSENKSLSNGLSTNWKNHLVVADISGCGFLGGSVSSTKTYNGLPAHSRPKKCVAKKLTEIDTDLCELLLHNTKGGSMSYGEEMNSNTKQATDDGRKRKLARMLAIREAERHSVGHSDNIRVGQKALVNKEERTLKIKDLQTVDNYRSRLKPNHITELLTLAITTQCTIRPSLGKAHFIEMQLKNPFSKQHTITIETDSSDFRVITDAREWRYFKSLHNLHTPTEENMFSFDQVTSMPQVYLRPKETVYIPFRYQGFEVGKEISSGPTQFFKPTSTILQPIKASSNHGIIKPKVVKAYLRTSAGKALSVLQVNIEPLPHVIDQTFRFYNPESTFLKKCIRLPPFSTDTTGISQFHVECSDPEIICQARSSGTNEPQEVFMKAPCGQSPSVRRFYLALYNDSVIANPIQIWQFYVHSLQKVYINTVLGQTTRLALVLKGTQSTRKVKCYSSHPLQMEVFPKDSFLLTANSVTELTVGVRPIGAPGTRYMYVNVVDVEYHQLVRSWLVAVNTKLPIVSKEFEIVVPLAGGKECMKKITFTNPYPARKTFQLLTSRPDLLTFRELQFELAAGQTHTIGLRFAAGIHQPGRHLVHVFIDDRESKNEEIFLIVVNYI